MASDSGSDGRVLTDGELARDVSHYGGMDIKLTGPLLGDWRDGYNESVAKYIVANGRLVELRLYRGPYESWRNRADDDYDDYWTSYGWSDDSHLVNVRWKAGHKPCRIISADQSTVRERTLSEFSGSDADNLVQVGMEVKVTCACGMYTDRWMRWEGSASDALKALLGWND